MYYCAARNHLIVFVVLSNKAPQKPNPNKLQPCVPTRILLGICGSVIVALLLLSLYQCIQEEYSEYQSQRTAGNLPSDNSWYYYDYGTSVELVTAIFYFVFKLGTDDSMLIILRLHD